MQVRISKERRERKYLNFQAAAPIRCPSTNECYTIPILPTNYNKIQLPYTTIRIAYVTYSELNFIMSLTPLHQETFNKILMRYPYQLFPIIDPHRIPTDFSISQSVYTEATVSELKVTHETGEFANISVQNHMIQSYWHKSFMSSFDIISSGNLQSIMRHTFGTFKFARSRTPCLGINIYNGKFSDI